jgi:hypothetical protein
MYCVCNAHDNDRAESGVRTLQVKVNHDSFDEAVAQLKPDFVIFDRFLMVRALVLASVYGQSDVD